jgi:DNA adenine methylase
LITPETTPPSIPTNLATPPLLKQHWSNPDARYVEPFCGSACLYFDLEPKDAILSDINTELIATYRALKHDASRVVECLRRFPLTEKVYYSLRSMNPGCLSRVELAARFLFLNRLCFNGIYRTNRDGNFNVPYGQPKHKPFIDEESLLKLAVALKRATLLEGDFELVLQETQLGDFVYLDPPYALSKRRVFAEYHPDSFSNCDLLRLAAALDNLQERGVHFVVSYADCTEGRKLVYKWNWRRIRTKRNVAGFVSHRRSAYELIASNRELLHGC